MNSDPKNSGKPDWEHVHWQMKPKEEDEPNSPMTRWAIILMGTLIGAVIFGSIVAFYPYYEAYFTSSRNSIVSRSIARREVQSDTPSGMKLRYWLGAGGGAVVSGIWLYCIVKKDADENA